MQIKVFLQKLSRQDFDSYLVNLRRKSHGGERYVSTDKVFSFVATAIRTVAGSGDASAYR